MTYINTYYMPIDSDEQFEKHLARRLNATYASNPEKAGDKLILLDREVRYVPVFHTAMTLDHWSYNTTGRAVHHEHEDVNALIRASQNLVLEDKRFIDYVLKNKKSQPSLQAHDMESDGGNDIYRLVNSLINELVRRNTYQYTYKGNNGQTYTRRSDPKSNDVYVHNADVIFIVESHIEYIFSGKKFSFDTIETQSPNFYKYTTENNMCSYCNQVIDWDGMVCNECGKTFHKKHGHECSLCKKTLCPDCESKYKKLFILKRYLCHDCVSKNPKIKIIE